MIEDRGSFVYRCRNCKKKFSNVSYPDATTSEINSIKTGNGMLSIHNCLNGNVGIADLIAVETTDVEKHKRLARL